MALDSTGSIEPILLGDQSSQSIPGFYETPTSNINNNSNNTNPGGPTNQETFGEIAFSPSNNNSDASPAAYVIALAVVFSVFAFSIGAACYVFIIRRSKRDRKFQREMERQYVAAQAACSESMLEKALEHHERLMVRHLHMLGSSSRQPSPMTESTQCTTATSSTVIATNTTNNLLPATAELALSMHKNNSDPPRYWPPDPTLSLPQHAVARFSQALLMSHLVRASVPISSYPQQSYHRSNSGNSNNNHRSYSVNDNNNEDNNINSFEASPIDASLQGRDGLPKYSELFHPCYQPHRQTSSLSLPEDMPPPHQDINMSHNSSPVLHLCQI
ncbi:hypothetical protein INT45_012045 [Circinella minor]|uniref:Uncharacterized protein n=1 Tax=Circinella minor TaxID=1195481 RepID=A0A8H7VMD9_9FUNG|nr:hypothetical protein INT45_012045 [Circinella minor]